MLSADRLPCVQHLSCFLGAEPETPGEAGYNPIVLGHTHLRRTARPGHSGLPLSLTVASRFGALPHSLLLPGLLCRAVPDQSPHVVSVVHRVLRKSLAFPEPPQT